LDVTGGFLLVEAGSDADGLAGGQLAVEPGGGDADALLAAAHAEAVEFRAVEELREDAADLLGDDARAVVGDGDDEALGLGDGDFALLLGHVLRADAVDDGFLDFLELRLELGNGCFFPGRRGTAHGIPLLLRGWTGFGSLGLQVTLEAACFGVPPLYPRGLYP